METTTKKTTVSRLSALCRLCPARHLLCAFGGLLLAAYFALRSCPSVMAVVSGQFVRPLHRLLARLTGALPFSAAECLIAAGVCFALLYTLAFVVGILFAPGRGRRLYRFFLTWLTAFVLIYSGFCLLWGVYYYTSDFEEQSGISAGPVSTEQLSAVTRYFTDLVNEYGAQVPRDGSGLFAANKEAYFARSPELYAAIEKQIPCLAGDKVSAKRVFFSLGMSYIRFTGFYFPFTGEANVNVHSPACLIPSTIAHEQAHQRGVAQEDEANFCAVLASLADGDPVYCYSACLLAYIHLGNALYHADYDAWVENYARLSPEAKADLAANNAYWARFETPVSSVSDTVYTGFLHSYGQTLGLQTYGKCVDLLVTYYYGRLP